MQIPFSGGAELGPHPSIFRTFSHWLAQRTQVRKINATLVGHPEIKVSKAKDFSGTGLHWYYFRYLDETFNKSVKGTGSGFTDKLAIFRAWGEFVERYSFRAAVHTTKQQGAFTSNGFASHIDVEKAKANALAELIERDVFLSCWLARVPALSFDSERALSPENQERLRVMTAQGYKIDFGLFGSCMDHLVGIVIIRSASHLSIATAAKRTLEELADHFVHEAAVTISDTNSPSAVTPLETLSREAKPIDHLRYYLSHSGDDFVKQWLLPSGEARVFPEFSFRQVDLTPMNQLALESGYVVYRAISANCQNLWFGPTEPRHVNLDRFKKFTNRTVTYEELNLEPHPLA